MAKLKTIQDTPKKTDGEILQNDKGVLKLKKNFILLTEPCPGDVRTGKPLHEHIDRNTDESKYWWENHDRL